MPLSRNFLFISVIMCAQAFAAQASDTVIHPAPRDPIYLETSLYPSLKRDLPKPPKPGSKEQEADERELLLAQAERTPEECARAQAEVRVSLRSFFGPPVGPLSDAEVQLWESLLDRAGDDANFFVQKMKIDWPRPRPFLYLPKLKPCVPREVTGAYPSGHAVIATLDARLLSELYPERAQIFEERAREIRRGRVLSGMHHPSDIRAGQVIGARIYEELKRRPRFNEALRSTVSVRFCHGS